MRDGSTEFGCRFDPLLDNLLRVGESLLVGFAVGHASGELRHLGHVGIVLRTPKNDDFVFLIHSGLAIGYKAETSNFRLPMLW